MYKLSGPLIVIDLGDPL